PAAEKWAVVATGRLLESRTWSPTPLCAARSRTVLRSAPPQPWFRSHEAAAAAAVALARSVRCWFASEDTSTAVNTAASTAIRAPAASATPRNNSASGSPSVVPRCPLPDGPRRAPGRGGGEAGGVGEAEASLIATQAKPVAPAEHGQDDARAARV